MCNTCSCQNPRLKSKTLLKKWKDEKAAWITHIKFISLLYEK